MSRANWFEISNEGWRRMNAGRPLSALLKEAIQNAFDERVQNVEIIIDGERIVIEDDSPRGFADESLIYTVFLTDKEDTPTKRGRKGRGLKELIAAMDAAAVETIGKTISFDSRGRSVASNRRRLGTCVELSRVNLPAEIDEARAALSLIIPPKGTALRVNGHRVRPPRLHLILSPCYLETVVIRDGVERLVERGTAVELYHPRQGEAAHLFEMGIPIEPINLPWHVDVQQRIPLSDHRNTASEAYKLTLKTLLLESLISRYLDSDDLAADWVHDVLARHTLSDQALECYVARMYPPNAILGGSPLANDRARQLGANVIDATSMPRGTYAALTRVMERAEDFVRRKEREFNELPLEPDAEQQRFSDFVRWLAKRILGIDLRVTIVRKDPTIDGIVEDAAYDKTSREIKFNVLGKVDFSDPLAPTSLGVVFHEFAHQYVTEHDQRFIEHLQQVAGRGAAILAAGGPPLATRIREGRLNDTDRPR
jgi:hypothetical protein